MKKYDELIDQLEKEVRKNFQHDDGSFNKYRFCKNAEIYNPQVSILFDKEKNPTLRTFLKAANSCGIDLVLIRQ